MDPFVEVAITWPINVACDFSLEKKKNWLMETTENGLKIKIYHFLAPN